MTSTTDTATENARTRILREYRVDDHGIIRSPGKFEGEQLYVPYFWDCYLDGMADRDDGRMIGFDISPGDRQLFPELGTRKRTVRLYQRDDGLVCEG